VQLGREPGLVMVLELAQGLELELVRELEQAQKALEELALP